METEVRRRFRLPAVGSQIRFDRNELAGAFGDIGTDLPLIVGMLIASGADGASVFFVFGLLQILSGFFYGIPMPVQPLKAVAAIAIAEKVAAPIIFGAGLSIGVVMLILTLTGVLSYLVRVIPKAVVRGIQFGLGLKLGTLAVTNFVLCDSLPGYLLAGAGFCLTVLLLGNRRFPSALILIGAGLVYGFARGHVNVESFTENFHISLPAFQVPALSCVWEGFLLLAVAQIPLSLGNSILATCQIAKDFFPYRKVTASTIGFTYSLWNLVAPFLGGFPVCHGSGGIAGHYAFGARTGGSTLIYGSMYLLLGLLFGRGLTVVVKIFPLPILGVILFFEGLTLMLLVRDTAERKQDLFVVFVVALAALTLPYGFLVGFLVGTALWYLQGKVLRLDRTAPQK